MSCKSCKHWLTQQVTDYADGSRVVNFQAPAGKGLCEELDIHTVEDFHCSKYVRGAEHIRVMGRKSGSPWHHHVTGTCPDCNGVGWSCRRCAGTGAVWYYDDGYIGENQNRRHPKELEGLEPPRPHCIQCSKDIDLAWMNCPYCGTKIDKQAPPVMVTSLDHGLTNSNNPRA